MSVAPDKKDATAERARQLADANQYAQAIKVWRQLLDGSPNDANVYNTIGDLSLKIKNNPGAIDAYRKTGHFPDGAVLVKEVFATSTNEMTTGTVSHADKLKGWFVMVRDSKGTHPGNPLWGDGWGWSWFDADKPLRTPSTDYHSDCKGCHVPAKATDWIYVNGYPVLRH